MKKMLISNSKTNIKRHFDIDAAYNFQRVYREIMEKVNSDYGLGLRLRALRVRSPSAAFYFPNNLLYDFL